MKSWVQSVCIKRAYTSSYKKHMHGCVLESGGRIIADGTNSIKPINPAHGKYSTHAEVCAILKAGKNAPGTTLYVAKVDKGHIKNSKPCPACMIKIREAGIRRICYSLDDVSWIQQNLW